MDITDEGFFNLTDGEKLNALRDQAITQQADLNSFFLIVMGILVFFMQAGFAFLEAGAVRIKNTTNILLKNYLDVCFGAAVYWAVGWAFAYGTRSSSPNPFIGTSQFFLIGTEDYPSVFFQFVFSATASTIVSGALAERTDFKAYMIYSCLISGFVYPVVSHWVWDSSGWLAELGMVDYAGSAVVHAVGGSAALVGAFLVGPRIGRFNADGTANEIPGQSTAFAALGAFILWTGFYAFNGGSELVIVGSGFKVGQVIINTTLAGAFGSLGSLALAKLIYRKWSLLQCINGSLGGMVAICAGVAHVEPWAAMVIGLIASMVYTAWSLVMVKLRIDDPLDAVAVHLGCGIWGALAAPIFASNRDVEGVFYTGKFRSFGINVAGVVAIVAWTLVLSLIIFGALRLLKRLRISEEAEIQGADDRKHREPAYPYHMSDEYPVKRDSISLKPVASDRVDEKKVES